MIVEATREEILRRINNKFPNKDLSRMPVGAIGVVMVLEALGLVKILEPGQELKAEPVVEGVAKK